MGYDGIHDLPRHMVVVGVRVGVIDHLRWTLWLHAPRLLSMSAQRKERYNNPQWKPKQVAHAPCVQPGGPALLIWRNLRGTTRAVVAFACGTMISLLTAVSLGVQTGVSISSRWRAANSIRFSKLLFIRSFLRSASVLAISGSKMSLS